MDNTRRCGRCYRQPDVEEGRGLWYVSCHGVVFSDAVLETALRAWDRYEIDVVEYRIAK